MKTKRIKPSQIVISIAVIIFILLGFTAYLALWKGGTNTNTAASTSLILERIRALQKDGGTLEISAEEINGMFKSVLDKPVTKGGITINGGYVDINGENISVYVPVKYRGFNLLPNITGSLQYDGNSLIVDVKSIKIGKLRLPKAFVMGKLQTFSSEDIKIQGNRIEVSKYLLPFRTSGVQIVDGKIVARIEKLVFNQQSSTGANQNPSSGISTKSNTNTASTSQGTNGSNTNSNAQGSQGNNSSSNTTSNSQQGNNQAVETSAKAQQKNSLVKVSGELNNVIADLSTAEEKRMVKKIQYVVNQVANNPDYPYQAEANEVKAWFSKLDGDAKVRVKNAIMSNVDIINILKLINIFGV